jgi:hypothetical protein
MGEREREAWERRRQFTIEVRRILLHEWDPIGVADCEGAEDEYDSYVPGVLGVISQGGGEVAVVEFLRRVERERMELPDLPPAGAERAAKSLLEQDRRIWATPPPPAEGTR